MMRSRIVALVLAVALAATLPASAGAAAAVAAPTGPGDPGLSVAGLVQDPAPESPESPESPEPPGDAEAPEAPDPAHDAPAIPTPDDPASDELAQDEPRGPDGGIASDSPGPATARERPAGDEPELPLAVPDAAGGLVGDDYPAKYKNLPMTPVQWDEWNFAHRQCTSFVSWRLNRVNGIPFSNQYGGLTRWGDAGQWRDSARSLGIRVDTTPAVGSIAWSGPFYEGASGFGHVAWVAQVLPDGRIVIEEYNNGWLGAYGTRTIHPDQFQAYIHVADLGASFTDTPRPTVSGAPMVNGTLTASLSGWSPAPTSLRYQWLRNGTDISGASQRTYQPRLADVDARISVEVTGSRSGYRPHSATSAAQTVRMADTDGNGIDDTQELLPWNSDVTGDGLPDAVGFGKAGVTVALRTASGFGTAETWAAGFGTDAGWDPLAHPRTLVDVNGDGKSDVVGFASAGVYVALSTGDGFRPGTRWSSEFGTNSGYSVRHHPRTLADVTGDGRPDIVAFAANGVYVAENAGSSFAPATRWYTGFGTANGWTVDADPRWLVDINGNGRADIVGISNAGVYVALSNGSGFDRATRWASAFGSNTGWDPANEPRALADVTGNGLPDVVGFAHDGVSVATNPNGTGLAAPTRWTTGMGSDAGWRIGSHPRVLADMTGDGRADLVGFASAGVYVARSTGSGFQSASRWSSEFASSSRRSERQPRLVTDVTGNGLADVVGFDTSGVRVAENTGSGLRASRIESPSMGYGSGWRNDTTPRMVGVQRVSGGSVSISGTAATGQSLIADAGVWRPRQTRIGYQWLRDGEPIPGRTGSSYTFARGDYGRELSVHVTGEAFGYAPTGREAPALVASPFADVAAGDRFFTEIAWMYATELSNGIRQPSGPPAYQPGTRVSREAMAAFLYRLEGEPAWDPPKLSPFTDLPTNHQFYDEITWLADAGITTGKSNGDGTARFDPTGEVSREAMAAFIYRYEELQNGEPIGYTGPARSAFTDMQRGARFYDEIEWMRAEGLTTGKRNPGSPVTHRYDPMGDVSREAMAAFIYRYETQR